MRTQTRYYLLQIPGWVLAAIVLMALHRWIALPMWVVVTGLVVLVIKDIVLYPYLRKAYETRSPDGAERLIGESGEVRRALQPEGYIQLAGELWQARVGDHSRIVPAGSRVRVEAVDGLVLIVSEELSPTADSVNGKDTGT